MSDALTIEEVGILAHALGFPRRYRNYYTAPSRPALASLVERGFMVVTADPDPVWRDATYAVTLKGEHYLDRLHGKLIAKPLEPKRMPCPNCECEACTADEVTP